MAMTTLLTTSLMVTSWSYTRSACTVRGILGTKKLRQNRRLIWQINVSGW
jgi:hypothetical protein